MCPALLMAHSYQFVPVIGEYFLQVGGNKTQSDKRQSHINSSNVNHLKWKKKKSWQGSQGFSVLFVTKTEWGG